MHTVLLKLCLISCILTSYTFSANNEEQYNKIDAFSSASIYRYLKIYSCSKVYSDRAEIHWNEYYGWDTDVTSYKIKWGKDSTAYNDSIDFYNYHGTGTTYPEKTINKEILQPLEAGTKYYVQIYRDYNRELFNRNFVIATPPLDPIPPVPPDDSGYIDPNSALAAEYDSCWVDPNNPNPVKTRQLLTNSAVLLKNTHTVEIVTVLGQYIATYPVSVFKSGKNLRASGLSNGLYLVRFLDARKALIASKKLLIEN